MLAQHRRAVLRVLVERGVALVVEVVQQRHVAPRLLVLAALAGVGAHRRLDRERVPEQRLALRPLGQKRPGRVAIVHQIGHGRAHVPCGPRRAGQAGTCLPPTANRGYPQAMAVATRDSTVETFLIEGGVPLSGTVRPAGNKNAALPILAACLLTADPVTLDNVPRIRDVEAMIDLLVDIGVEVEWLGPNRRACVGRRRHARRASTPSCARASARRSCCAGPLLARFGAADVPPPGGDVIGRRRVDTHLMAFAALGRRGRGRPRVPAARAHRPARRRHLPGRGVGDRHRERGHGRRPGPRADDHPKRRLRAARAGSVRARCARWARTIEGIGSNVLDRSHGVERAARLPRTGSAPTTSRWPRSSAWPRSPAATW